MMMMTEQEYEAADQALVNWLASQNIFMGDAVIIMCRVVARCIFALARDRQAIQEGLNAAADMLRKMKPEARNDGDLD